jgi:hypothetical protein
MDAETVFKYSELSEKAKENARIWWLESMDDSDIEHVKEDAVTCLQYLGFRFTVRPIALHGGGVRQEAQLHIPFGYRADKATFDATWYANEIDMAGLMEHAPQDTVLHGLCARMMAVMLRYPEALASFGSESRRNHEVMECYWAYTRPEDSESDEALESELNNIVDDCAQWVTDQAAAEYEYQTSDAVVAENIEANEYDFDEDGHRV